MDEETATQEQRVARAIAAARTVAATRPFIPRDKGEINDMLYQMLGGALFAYIQSDVFPRPAAPATKPLPLVDRFKIDLFGKTRREIVAFWLDRVTATQATASWDALAAERKAIAACLRSQR